MVHKTIVHGSYAYSGNEAHQYTILLSLDICIHCIDYIRILEAVAWDNPTYEGHMTSNDTEVEKKFENPLYTDVDLDSTSAAINQHLVTRAQDSKIYEGIDTGNIYDSSTKAT